MSLPVSEGSMGVAVGPSVGCAQFDFFAAPDGRWCGGVGVGGIGERVGREGGAGAGWYCGPPFPVGCDGGREFRLVCVKDNLTGDLSKDQGGLGGLRNVLAQVGNEPWGSRVPWPPPRWRSTDRNLVEEVNIGTAIHIGSSTPLA